MMKTYVNNAWVFEALNMRKHADAVRDLLKEIYPNRDLSPNISVLGNRMWAIHPDDSPASISCIGVDESLETPEVVVDLATCQAVAQVADAMGCTVNSAAISALAIAKGDEDRAKNLLVSVAKAIKKNQKNFPPVEVLEGLLPFLYYLIRREARQVLTPEEFEKDCVSFEDFKKAALEDAKAAAA